MTKLKPFIRVTILSSILAGLLIYLGIKYHWVERFKGNSEPELTLAIPEKADISSTDDSLTNIKSDGFNPEIINSKAPNTLLESMNKEQIAEQCVNLLSKELKDPLILELATVNCVVSNYEDTFQNTKITDKALAVYTQKKNSFSQQCKNQYLQNQQYSRIETELLVGICVSDRLNKQ